MVKDESKESQPKRIRRSDLARALGVSPAAVTKAISAGRIPAPDADGLLDLDEAMSAWRANTRAAANQTNDAPREKRAPGGQTKYSSARARKELALAQHAEIDLDRKVGALLDRAEVEFVIEDAGTRMRQTLEDLPARLAARLAHRDMQFIEGELQYALDEALREFSERLAKAAEVTV